MPRSEPASLTEALAHPAEVTWIRVDQEEDPAPLFARLGAFVALERLYLRGGLPAGVALPAQVPARLVALELVVSALEPEVDRAVRAFPGLEVLEVWGRHLKEGALPASIAGLTRLRELRLVSCGISDLPPEIAALGALRALVIRGCPIRSFPLAITRIPHLTELALSAELVGLPDEVGEMTGLQALELQGCFNKGLAGSDAPFVNPVPAVLGRLVGLESLGLAQCGVSDELGALAPLTGLKRLDLSWGPLADLSGLAPLVGLEELVLQSCYKARDLAPLGRLPRLRKLDVSGNHYLKDVSGLTALTALEELDLDGCGALKSLLPVLEHPTLKILRAKGEIAARWEQRQRLVGMPSPEVLRERLGSDDLATVADALGVITTYVQLTSSERSAAYAFFGVKPGRRLVDVPEVDQALARWGADLPSPLLLEVVKMGMASILDDLRFTVTAADLLADRVAVAEQREVARLFHHACRHYDSGHRSWDDTVLDHLIEDVFPRYVPGALAELLEPLGGDALSSQSGDAMDGLFVAGLAHAPDLDPSARESLIDRFCRYAEEMIGYDHADVVARLREAIAEVDPAAGAEIADRLGALAAVVALQEEVEAAQDVGAVMGLLARIRDPEDPLTFARADDVSAFSGRVVAVADQLADDVLWSLLEDGWRAEAGGWDWARLLATLFRRDPVAAAARVIGWTGSQPVVGQVALAKRIQIREAGDDPVATALRATEARLLGEDPAVVATRELGPLLLAFAQGHSDADWAAAIATLHRIGAQREPVATTWEHFSYLQMKYEQLVRMVPYEPAEVTPKIRAFLEAFVASLPRITWKQASIETMAADAVAVAQLSGDAAIAALVFAHLIPAQVTKDRLAFNLACYHASRGERDQVLRWTRRAIALGKPAAQFRADSDFAAFVDDPEFLALL